MKASRFLRVASSLFIFLQFTEFSNGDATAQDMQRLHMDLVSSSSKEVRPMRNISDSLTIAVSLKLLHIHKLDFKKGTVTARINVEQIWNNYMMRWDPKAYGGIKKSVLPSSKLWLPDIALYNSANEDLFFSGPSVKVFYTGYQEWKSTQTVKVRCKFEIINFPNDEHSCFFKLASWTYDGLMLDVQHKLGRSVLLNESENATDPKSTKTWNVVGPGIDLSEQIPSPKWNVTKTNATNTEKYYPCCQDPYTEVYFHFTVKRLGGVYTTPESMAWLLLTLLPILIFLIPVQSNQKLGFASANFLIFILVLTSTAQRSDSQVFLMPHFYLFTLILDFLTICGVVAVVGTYSRNTTMPKVLKKFLPILRKCTFSNCSKNMSPADKISTSNDMEPQSPALQCIDKYLKAEQEQEAMKSSWNSLSDALNRVCLFITTILSLTGIVAFLS